MEVTPHHKPSNAAIRIAVVESSQVGEARRSAAALSSQLGFNETRAGMLAIIVTELANNLVKHGGGGEMLMRPISPSGGAGGGEGEPVAAGAGIEVLSLDRGRGIPNVNAAMRDGFTTGSTPGTGLGAVRRLSSLFDISSGPGRGTAIVSRVWPGEPPVQSIEVGVCCVPIRGERVCGDAWTIVEHRPDHVSVLVADGLGHGPSAAAASQLATRVMRERAQLSPRLIVEELHAALRPTRGAAVAVAEIDFSKSKTHFCGVGNISSAIVLGDGVSRGLVSHNGTVGAQTRRIMELEHPFPEGSLLILSSDGITSRWHLSDYPGLSLKHPSLIAGVIYRDHLRGPDDATVLVLRGSSAAR